MLDTLIKNALIVTAEGRSRGSIGIRGEHIAGLYEAGAEPQAKDSIDAGRLAVLPGAIDMHCHHREGASKGYEYKETILTATRQCAAGGITTSVGMPNVVPPPNSAERLKAQFALYDKSAIVDWNFNPAGTVPANIPELARQGIAAFKIFMVVDTGRDYPHMPGIGVHDHGKIMEIMEACAAVNVPLMVHPHDQALMDHIEKAFWARGERDALAYAKAYSANDGVIWDTAIQTLLRLQRATGVHLHILHTQTSGSVELIREAKRRGQRVTCEINPWALFLGCDWSAIQRLGSYALSYYVPEKNLPILWDGVNDGTIDILASDHAPHTREEKEIGWKDGWKAHTGTPSAQHYMSMLVDAAHQGRTTLETVARITSANPAGIFGLQNKGRIQVGCDADLVLIDLEAQKEIRDEDTLGLIGRTVFADGKVVGEPGKAKQARAVYPGKTAKAA